MESLSQMTNVIFRQLRALIAIKTHGRIIAAAKAVGLTGPAVTLQLKQLEEEAGAGCSTANHMGCDRQRRAPPSSARRGIRSPQGRAFLAVKSPPSISSCASRGPVHGCESAWDPTPIGAVTP